MFGLLSSAQLRGPFGFHYGYEGILIDFKNHKNFKYHFSHCTGASEGAGIYKIEDSLLTLTFQTQHLPEINITYLDQVEGLDSIEISFHINVPDLDTVYSNVSGRLNNENDHRAFHVSSHKGAGGLNKSATVKSSTDTLEFTLHSWRSGRFKTYSIVPYCNQVVHINYFASGQYDDGHILEFGIRGITQDSIELDRKDYYKGYNWYKRINE